MQKVDIKAEVLHNLYWQENLSSTEIGKMFGINGRTVRKKLKRLGIKSKTISQALTKKFKFPFSGDLSEKAYFLGLRAGDFYAKPARKSVRVQTSTTHPAQLELLRKSFESYGETRVYLSKNRVRQDEWFCYVDLHHSFKFLLKKPKEIEPEILNDFEAFYSFLSAYSDCESNWNVAKNHKNSIKLAFRLRTGDKTILEQLKQKLEEDNYSVSFGVDKERGTKTPYGTYRNPIYYLALNRKADIFRMASVLLVLSKHQEKIDKMSFILENKNKSWDEINPLWQKVKEGIKESLLKTPSQK